VAKTFKLGSSTLEFDSGYVYVTEEGGQRTRVALASLLRAADIPTGLTYSQVQGLTGLTNMVVVLIRTLIHRGVLDESFLEDNDYSLDDLIESIENLGGDYGEPDITVDT